MRLYTLDSRKIVLGAMVAGKRAIREELYAIGEVSDVMRAARRKKRFLEAEKSPFNKTKINALEIFISELDKHRKSIKDKLIHLGQMAIDLAPAVDEFCTLHDMAQLCGISHIAMDGIVKDIPGGREQAGFVNLVFAHHAEYVHGKGDFVPPWHPSTPFFSAVYERMMHEIDENQKLRKEMHEKFDEMFPDISHYQRMPDGSFKPVLRAVKERGV